MKRIFEYFASNRMVVTIMVIMIVLIGLFSLFSIKQEITPTVDSDWMIVTVSYPGASPSDIENNVVLLMERELKAITGIKEYSSVIVENMATINVTLEENLSDARQVKDEIIRTMNNVSGLPYETDVNVIDMNPKLMSVYTIGVRAKEGKNATQKELYSFAKNLKDLLSKKVNDIAEINMNGYEDPEVHIFVNPYKMNQCYISLNDVANSLENRNVRSTGGTLKTASKDETIITIGEFKSPEEAKSVIIRSSFDNNRVYIKDIARIEDGFKEKDVVVRVNKTPSVIMSIVKKENSDIVQTIENVKSFLKRNQTSVPDNLEILSIQDNSRSIRSLIHDIQRDLLLGIIFVLIALAVFLDRHSAIWVSAGIIIVVLMTLIYISFKNISFNMISLAAIITVLGMIVDDGVVVAENIHTYRQRGFSAFDATIKGLSTVFGAVVVSTFSTVAAFAPILQVSGMMGKFIHQFPVLIIVTFIASLFQSVFILPNQVYYSFISSKKLKKPKKEAQDWFMKFADQFAVLLRRFMKFRYAILCLFIVLLIGTVVVSGDSLKRFVLMQDSSSDTIRIVLETTENTSLEKTSDLTKQMEDIVLKNVGTNELIAEQAMIGKHLSGRDRGSEIHPNWSQVTVYLVPVNDRKRNADMIIKALRAEIEKHKVNGFTSVIVEKVAMGPDTGKPVEVKLAGKDISVLSKAKDDIKEFLAGIKGVVNIDDNQKLDKNELIVGFKHDIMAQYNLSVTAVASTIRTAYAGRVATYIQRDDEELDFRVQLDPKYRTDVRILENLLIPNTSGRLIRLKDVATLTSQKVSDNIRHYNGDRTVTVQADIQPKTTTSQEVMQKVLIKYGNISKTYEGVSLLFGGEIEETQKSLRQLAIAFLLALLAIYLVLVLQFNHIIEPFLILSIIPFGIIGALIAFGLHGIPLSFMGIIGIIGLGGIVVKNGIVMIDLINKLMQEQQSLSKEAMLEDIINGARMRLRPIIITTITTTVALFPTAYLSGSGTEMVRPIVIALIYGLLFATLLTLVLLPCMMMIAVDLGLIKYGHKKIETSSAISH
jgi:multidrug efflux pump subunit AcrB